MSGYSDQEILEAIQQLRSNLSEVLLDADAKALEVQLQEILSQAADQDRQPLTVTRSLEAIREYPAARDELKARLIRMAGLRSETRLGMSFETIPGYGEPVRPGTRVVCPVDPTHYITRLRLKGQRCPQHNVELVPEENRALPNPNHNP